MISAILPVSDGSTVKQMAGTRSTRENGRCRRLRRMPLARRGESTVASCHRATVSTGSRCTMVVSPNPNPYSPTMRCEGSGSPSDRPASIAGQLVGVCVTCRQVVPVLAAGPYATCEHSRGDVLALFYDECT